MWIDPDDPLREEKKSAGKKIVLLIIVVVALTILAVYAASAHLQKDHKGIFVCDTYYKFHMVMEAHLEKGYALGVSAFNAYARLPNKYGNPSCGFVKDAKDIIWVESLETFHGLKFPNEKIIKKWDVELWLVEVVWQNGDKNFLITRKITPNGMPS